MSVYENYLEVEKKVQEACKRAGRNREEVTLIAVSKTKPVSMIEELLPHGVVDFGENKVQELTAKYEVLPKDLNWHLIGHLQSNKIKKIVGQVDMIQSVDSFETAQQISRRSGDQGITTDILLEVNIGEDENKFGYSADEVADQLGKISELRFVKVKGMMTVAPNFKDSVKNQCVFDNMHKLFIDIGAKKMDNIDMDILSMGMSGDFKEAIAAGSTLVRIGSAIFGDRQY